MKLISATIVPIVLAGLATNCDPGNGGGGGGNAGAADAGESAEAGAGGSTAGETGSSGADSGGASAGDGAGGEADGPDGGGEGGEDGVGTGGATTGGAANGGAASGAGGTVAGESAAGAAGDPSPAQGGTAGTGTAAGSGGVAAGGNGGMGMGGTGATAGSGVAAGGSGGVTPAIQAVAWLQPDSCERRVPFEVRDVRYEDGTPVTDYTCEWTFTDGRVFDTCAGNVVQGGGEILQATVVVRDSATGATTTATTEAVLEIEPQALEVYTESDNCMEFSYDIDRQYGCGGTHTIDIQPAENIVTPGPWSIHFGVLQVSTPGVYTVTYTVEGCAPHYARTCVTTAVSRVTVEECAYP